MSVIIDRRGSNNNRLAGSRKKFIDRYKKAIVRKINKHIENSKSIKDLADSNVPVDLGGIKEVHPKYNSQRSIRKSVHPGNRRYLKGDKVRYDGSGGKAARAASNSDELTNDDFQFILTKQEFIDLLFEDMELPNFLKKSSQQFNRESFVSGGYIKHGIPARLAIKKTLEMAAARRIASGDRDSARFLDDIDLRFRNLIPEEKPISTAVVFMLLDVSGSMDEKRKLIAKKFFLLFYLFLNKHYKNIEIRFIGHTTNAMEMTEEEFFYSTLSGGTIMSSAVALVNKLIDTEYNVNETNFYVAQASDGDNWTADDYDLLQEIDRLLPKLQYFSYIEVDNVYPERGTHSLYNEYYKNTNNMASVIINDESGVLHALRGLFKKRSNK